MHGIFSGKEENSFQMLLVTTSGAPLRGAGVGGEKCINGENKRSTHNFTTKSGSLNKRVDSVCLASSYTPRPLETESSLPIGQIRPRTRRQKNLTSSQERTAARTCNA